MVVLLVISTVLVVLVIDHILLRRKVGADWGTAVHTPRVMPALPALIGGFEVRDSLAYHPGHTWALGESPELVRVGLDDLAARLVGRVDRITLPSRGQWIRQGQKVVAVHRNGNHVELVSPIEGTVVDLNESVLADPSLALQDPYGQGWLLKVNAPDIKTNLRNLLLGAMARRWMDEAAARLRGLLATPGLMTAVPLAQDGGVALDDVAAHLPGADWEKLGREFFLT